MNIRNPDIRSLLAAEYVLGTLQGRARRRFETLASADPELQREADRWDEHLHAVMTRQLDPVTPPETLRERIMQRIGADSGAGVRAGASARQPRRAYRRRCVWTAAAVAATVAVVALLLLSFGAVAENFRYVEIVSLIIFVHRSPSYPLGH